MFITMLGVTFLIAFAVSFIVDQVFKRPVRTILRRIIQDEISSAWIRYLRFAVYVVGVSGGVRVWELEQYITPRRGQMEPVALNTDRWVLESYRTVIGTLQSTAWLLLVFFVIALIAYVVVRIFGKRR